MEKEYDCGLQIVTFEHFFGRHLSRAACKFARHCHSKRAKTFAESSVKCEAKEEKNVNAAAAPPFWRTGTMYFAHIARGGGGYTAR